MMQVKGRLRGAAVAVALLACVSPSLMPTHAQAWQPGAAAPDFELQDLQGQTVRLESFRGKVVLLNFWSPWCASCRHELHELGTLQKRYQKSGLEVIGIALGTDLDRLKGFLRKFPPAFTHLSDRKEAAGNRYKVSGLPTTVIINTKGIIAYRHTGFDREAVSLYEDEINRLLKR